MVTLCQFKNLCLNHNIHKHSWKKQTVSNIRRDSMKNTTINKKKHNYNEKIKEIFMKIALNESREKENCNN